MDLGISDKKAIVCASSEGLGFACAQALVEEGVAVTINGRDPHKLLDAVSRLRALDGGEVNSVAADIRDERGREQLLAACAEPDILVTNCAGPPMGHYSSWHEADWQAALHNNMITPIMLMKATVDCMANKGFGRIINITSAAVKSPIASLGLSNGARAGLTGFVAGLARQVAKDGVTINNLLPGPFATKRLLSNLQYAAEQADQSLEAVIEQRQASNPTGRFGESEELGCYCAFLCSVHAGYVTGQNIVLDGGANNSTL